MLGVAPTRMARSLNSMSSRMRRSWRCMLAAWRVPSASASRASAKEGRNWALEPVGAGDGDGPSMLVPRGRQQAVQSLQKTR